MLNSVSCDVECSNMPFNMPLNVVNENRAWLYSVQQVAACWKMVAVFFRVTTTCSLKWKENQHWSQRSLFLRMFRNWTLMELESMHIDQTLEPGFSDWSTDNWKPAGSGDEPGVFMSKGSLWRGRLDFRRSFVSFLPESELGRGARAPFPNSGW